MARNRTIGQAQRELERCRNQTNTLLATLAGVQSREAALREEIARFEAEAEQQRQEDVRREAEERRREAEQLEAEAAGLTREAERLRSKNLVAEIERELETEQAKDNPDPTRLADLRQQIHNLEGGGNR